MTYDGRKESVALWIPVDACRMVSVALRARLGSSLRAKYCKYYSATGLARHAMERWVSPERRSANAF